MNKISSFFSNLIGRGVAPTSRPSRLIAAAPALDIYGSSAGGETLDLAALDVLQWTPAWLLRAERLLIYALIFGLRPQRYLEIGTFKGGSALIVAAAMEASGNPGKMVCVDPRPQIAPEHWERLAARATLLADTSPGILPKAQAVVGGPFDFVFIDGDHTGKGVWRDAHGVLPFVMEGAYMLFHDSFCADVDQGIRRFIVEHADEVVDCGILTREVALEQPPQGEAVRWGGLRLVQVRRK